MGEKALVWLASSLEDLRGFPEDARRDAGYQLPNPAGSGASDWRQCPDVGSGGKEIRLQKAPKRDVDPGQKRCGDLVAARRKEQRGKR